MGVRGATALTPDEARELHRQALVIDSQQPPITAGLLFTDAMRRALAELEMQGRTRGEAAPILEALAAREIQTHQRPVPPTLICGIAPASRPPAAPLPRPGASPRPSSAEYAGSPTDVRSSTPSPTV